MTPIRDAAQVEYRLSQSCGCDVEHQAQVEYRLAPGSDMRWLGQGLAEVGLVVGDAVDPDAARLLMDGRDPRSGEQLVQRKRHLDPRGKLPASVLVDAVRALADADGIGAAEYLGTPGLAARFGRAERGIVRDGEAHLVPVADVERLAQAAGLDADALYGAEAVAQARRWSGSYVEVGIKGLDLTVDLPKSLSTVYAVASPEQAGVIERLFMESVDEGIAQAEEWTAYGMRGHHGDGERAERVATSGFLGWSVLHRGARPVDGSPGDPHLHAHIVIGHMARGEDGVWRTIAAGADDVKRHAHAVNEVIEARFRARLIEEFGARFERDAVTGAWELVGIPAELRGEFSRRAAQVAEQVGVGASVAEKKAAARVTAEAKDARTPQADVRSSWRERAAFVVGDVDAIVALALPGPGFGPGLGAGGGPRMPSPELLAAVVWEGERGLVAHRKVVARTDVLAAVAASVPFLLSTAQLEELTEQVLAVDGHTVRLRDDGRVHQSNRERYTHASVLEAETVIVEAALSRMDVGWGELTPAAAEMAVSTFETSRGFALSAEQRQVVQRLLTAGHGVDAVVGVAGAGKTTLLAAAHLGWEAAGLRVAGACTAAVAGAGLQAETGIATRTVAAWVAEVRRGGAAALDGVDVLVLDEAAMVDDRDMALLLAAAGELRVKVVGVGDPLQLQAIGVGGGFARTHQLVAGLALTENRRQRDAVERLALSTWRDGGRESALALLAGHDRVHATETPEEALTAMLAAWDQVRVRWAGDPHGQARELLLLAARNAYVEVLNGGARALMRQAEQLGSDVGFSLEGGERIAFAAGDQVRVRRNDYRTRRGGDVDVLNGFRGVVLEACRRRGALVEWTRPSSGGDLVERAWIAPKAIGGGALSHGYAMTIGAAQGATSTVTLAYGPGADAFSLYPGLSRAREASHLWLPLGSVEDPETRARLGEARSDRERLDRAVAAFGRDLRQDQSDRLVLDELAPPPVPEQAQPAAVEQATAVEAPAGRIGQEQREPEPRDASWRLVAQWAQEAPAEDVATTWRERPQGSVRSEDLPGAIEEAQAKLASVVVKRDSIAWEVAQLASVVGTERAPAAARITRDAEQVVAAASLVMSAQDKERLAGRLRQQQYGLWDEDRVEVSREGVMRRRAQTPAFKVTFRSGRVFRDADALRERIEERRTRINELARKQARLEAEARTEQRQADEIRRGLGIEHGESDTDFLTRRVGLWERADQRRLAELGKEAAKWEAAYGRGERHLGELESEREFRAGLDPRTDRQENRERRLQEYADARAERQASWRASQRAGKVYEQQAQQHSRRYDPPSPGRSGPSLGRCST